MMKNIGFFLTFMGLTTFSTYAQDFRSQSVYEGMETEIAVRLIEPGSQLHGAFREGDKLVIQWVADDEYEVRVQPEDGSPERNAWTCTQCSASGATISGEISIHGHPHVFSITNVGACTDSFCAPGDKDQYFGVIGHANMAQEYLDYALDHDFSYAQAVDFAIKRLRDAGNHNGTWHGGQ